MRNNLPSATPWTLFLIVLASSGGLSRSFTMPHPFHIPRIAKMFGAGGGRAPQKPNKIDQIDETWEASPTNSSEAKLIVIQCTDVYTLENFANMKTLIEETKAKAVGAKVVSVLTGDFLSPYLLSAVDNGAGMMNALAKTPIDYLTWGNHGT